MPEGTLRRGAPKRGPQKHQNAYAFKHNKNSKKTKMILKIAHNGLCKRCYDIIEWRKKYRKYKPLTAPAICNQCRQRNVKRAYHTLCDSCAGGRGVCAKCTEKLPPPGAVETSMDVESSNAAAASKGSSKGASDTAEAASSKDKEEEGIEEDEEDEEEGGNQTEDLSMEEDEEEVDVSDGNEDDDEDLDEEE